MKRVKVAVAGLTTALAAAALFFGPVIPAAQAGVPPMTRSEIVARAESALGLTYTWGRESWVPDAGSGPGTDCSGLALKCWEVPRTMLYQEEDGLNASISPRYTSYEFYNCLGPWFALASRSMLIEGDILVHNNGNSGHVVIYAGGDAWNSPVIYEAPGTGLKIRRAARYLGSNYLPRRRSSLVEGSTIVLDNPTAKSVGGSDVAGNWARSTSTGGYYGDDYQTQAATSGTAWARWTPRRRLVSLFSPRLGDRVAQIASGVVEGFQVIPSWRRLVPYLGHTLAYWLGNGVSVWVMGMSFDMGLDLGQAIALMAVVGVGIMIPAGPGFIGNFELFAEGALGLYVTQQALAQRGAAFILTLHATNVLWYAVTGAVALLSPQVSFTRVWRASTAASSELEAEHERTSPPAATAGAVPAPAAPPTQKMDNPADSPDPGAVD